MAYRPMKYQYETSPRKLKQEYDYLVNYGVKIVSTEIIDNPS